MPNDRSSQTDGPFDRRLMSGWPPGSLSWGSDWDSPEDALYDEPLPPMRYAGFGYRWRRFRARLHYIRWGFRLARDLPPWVGAKEISES